MATPSNDKTQIDNSSYAPSLMASKIATVPVSEASNDTRGDIAFTDRSPRNKAKQDAAVGEALRALTPQSYIAAVGWSPDNAAGTAGGKVLVAGLISAPKTNKGDVMGAINDGTLFVSVTLPGQTTAKVFTYNPSDNKWTMGKGTAKAIAGGRVVGFANTQVGASGLSLNGKPNPAAVGAGSAGVLVRVDEPVRFVKGLIKGADSLAKAMLAGQVITTGGTAVPAVALQNYARLFALQAAKNVADSTKVYVGVGYAASVNIESSKVQIKGLNGKFDLVNLAAAHDSPTKEAIQAVKDREVWIERQNRYPVNPSRPGRPTGVEPWNRSELGTEQLQTSLKPLQTVVVGSKALAYRVENDGSVSLVKPSDPNGEPVLKLGAGTVPADIENLMKINPSVANLAETVKSNNLSPNTNTSAELSPQQIKMG